jgi:glycosyltransferase involved in cell wall biosynthesis
MDERPRLSLVIPAYNEQENVPVLLERVGAALEKIEAPFEVLIVDDGSTDQTPALLAEGMKRYPWLRVLRMAQNRGQSAAFDAGFKAARGHIIATIDADLQNDPAEIPRLLGMMDGYDMITGWRQKRNDTFGRRVQTKIANAVRNRISGETIHDSASSLKLYRRECLAGMQLYNGMHRFMPTLVKIRGGRVLETPVSHSPRHAGTAKYGLRNRAFRALVDLFAVRWMKQRWLRYEVMEVNR